MSLVVVFALCLISILGRNAAASVPINPPLLISQETSTRAIALESLCLTSEPFALASPCSWGSDRRTRITLFALDLSLQPGENLSVVTADAEDAAQRHYDLTVEYIGPVPHQEWISAVVLRLNDNLGDLGDVLVRVSYQGISSNRVRIGIGHSGGGPPDDPGAVPTPVRPYAVAGQIRDDNNQTLDGIEVTLADNTDGTIRRTTSSNGGQFSFSAPAGHSFTVTPATTPIFSFNAQNINVLSSDRVLNWQAIRRTYSITGRLANAASVGIRDVVVNLSGFQNATTTSDNNGNYAFASLAAGRDYTITVPTTPYYTFTSQSLTNLSGNQIADFAGTLRSYTVNGSVQLGSSPAANLVMPISGSQTTSVITDANGQYSISLPAGGNYTITPSLTYYDFLPGSLVLTDLNSDHPGSNFNATRHTFTISGKLSNQGGSGLAGRTVTLTGAQQGSRLTDGNGNYQFTDLPAGFDYTVTAVTNPYYTFTPAQSFADLRSNQVADFAGTLRNYTVSGFVQLGSSPAANLVMPISGSQTTSVTTDANGRYSISLPAGGNYTITPSLTYYDFLPGSLIVTDLNSDQLDSNFNATRHTFTISGRLSDQEGRGLSGIAINLTGAAQEATETDNAGNYQFTDLLAGYGYTVTPPTTAAYTFTAQSVAELSSNQTLDFTGVRRRYQLNGRVLDPAGNGMMSITVTLTGSESGTAITAADGSYSFIATATGNYTVTPSIAQAYYTFAPGSTEFNNLTGPHTNDFTATLAPIPDPSYVLEFDGQQKTVDYGNFWPESVDLGHFFWEFWAMPGSNAGGTYLLSDGYGGAHALLFGVGSLNSSEPNRYELLGNIFDGVRFDNYFGSDQGPAIGEWAHFAVGWDGQNIITYYNGVPVGKTPFAGPRRTPGFSQGGGRLLIGGSDHSNFVGRIAQVRGYEDMNPRETLPGGLEASFAPQTVFSAEGNLLSYYFRTGGITVPDLSRGYNGISHSGWVRGTTAGILFDCGGCPPPQFVVDPSAPNFATNTAASPVSVPSPAGVPGGALVFDSFSRANSTYLFGSHGGLGSTEGGSAGPQVWQTNQDSTNPQPFGILNARAVLLANSTAVAWVPTGSATGNVDVRVNRFNGRWGSGKNSGLSFRVLDAANFFFAYTADTGDTASPRVVRVGYYLNDQRVDLTPGVAIPSSWTTLRVVTSNSGDLQVYIDGGLVFSTNSPVLASATGAGLYNNSAGLGLVNRWDNFTVFNAP